jgi:lysozyme
VNRPISKEALELIRHFEGFYPKPYLCPAGVATIGIGTVAYENGKKVSLKDSPITIERAEELLAFELSEKADTIARFLLRNSIILSEQQYSSLVSFAYNCGCGAIIDSGRTLGSAIRKKNLKSIAEAFLVYNKATVKKMGIKFRIPLAGLTRRREAERYLFLNGSNNFFEA